MDLENFLISNSKINKKFIKDFFGFQKTDQFKDYKPFTISLDDVAYWLESLKANLKSTLITSYIKDVDYIIINSLLMVNHEQPKHNKETIIITSDTFKMLCMRSKTKKADKVRQYYLNLEKLIDEYKDIIINNLNTKIKVLENDLIKDDLAKGGNVYIFEEIDQLNDKYIRIGSSYDVKKRMNNHNSSSLHKKKILYKIKTSNIKQFEKCLQTHFYNFRFKKNKDYYKISNDMIEKAIENCNGIIENFQNDNSNKIGGGKLKMIDMTPHQLDTQVKELLSFYSDNIMWNLYEKPEDAFYHAKKITTKRLNSIALDESFSNKLIILECQRASEYYRYLELKTKSYTYKEFFEELHNFYCNTRLTLEELKSIPNDYHDYVKDAIKEIKKNKKIYLIDIMGSLCRFENIYKVSNYDHVYRIFLGS
jgi:phage anti-repressor protein